MVQVYAVQERKSNMSYTATQNRCWYQKILQNSIKSARYTGGLRKLPLQYALILQRYLQKIERFTWFHNGIVNCLSKISTYAKYSDQFTYNNIDSFMNIVIDIHNFRIYDVKEYIRTSFPEIFSQTYDHRYLSRPPS